MKNAPSGAVQEKKILMFEQAGITQHMIVPAAAGKANAIEIFENLNRQLPSGSQTIAKISGAGRTALLVQAANKIGERQNTLATVIAIFYDGGD